MSDPLDHLDGPVHVDDDKRLVFDPDREGWSGIDRRAIRQLVNQVRSQWYADEVDEGRLSRITITERDRPGTYEVILWLEPEVVPFRMNISPAIFFGRFLGAFEVDHPLRRGILYLML